MGLGRAWSDEENEALARSWLFASETPIVGTDQSGTTLWASVHQRFLAILPSSTRSEKALAVRWTTVQREVGKFIGVYARLLDAQRSGSVEEDVRQLALQQYEKELKSSFKLMRTWRILHKAPKFTEAIAEKNKKNSAPATDNGGTKRAIVEGEGALPMGAKKAKLEEEKRKMRLRELSYAKQLVCESKNRNEMLRDHIGLLLFSMPPPQYTDAANYHAMLRRKYLRQAEVDADATETEEKQANEEEPSEEPSVVV